MSRPIPAAVLRFPGARPPKGRARKVARRPEARPAPLALRDNPGVQGPMITAALRKTHGNLTRAAELVGYASLEAFRVRVKEDHLWPPELPQGVRHPPGRGTVPDEEVTEALLVSRGVIEAAARLVRLPVATLRARLERHPLLWPESLRLPPDEEIRAVLRRMGGRTAPAATELGLERGALEAALLRRPSLRVEALEASAGGSVRGAPRAGDGEVTEAIRAANGWIAVAAEALGIGRTALERKLERRPGLWPEGVPRRRGGHPPTYTPEEAAARLAARRSAQKAARPVTNEARRESQREVERRRREGLGPEAPRAADERMVAARRAQGGSLKAAAASLGMHPSQISRRMEQRDLWPPELPPHPSEARWAAARAALLGAGAERRANPPADDAAPILVPARANELSEYLTALDRAEGAGPRRIAWTLGAMAADLLRRLEAARQMEDDRPGLALEALARWCRDPASETLSRPTEEVLEAWHSARGRGRFGSEEAVYQSASLALRVAMGSAFTRPRSPLEVGTERYLSTLRVHFGFSLEEARSLLLGVMIPALAAPLDDPPGARRANPSTGASAPLRFDVRPGQGGWALVVRAMRGSRRVGRVAVLAASQLGFLESTVRRGGCAELIRSVEREVGRPLRVFIVDKTLLEEAERGQGTGVAMYARAVEAAAALGGVLVPTSCSGTGGTSLEAQRVWRSRGLARRVAVFGGRVAYGGPEIPPGAREA